MSYSAKLDNEADYAKARVEDVNASFKDLTEVCFNIRGESADVAVEILEQAKAKKIPLRYRSHNTRMAHRKELQGQKGRWPVKCAGIVLKCLQSAIANAKEKGLSEELVVSTASANKKRSYMRYSSKGRRNTSKLETARVEIILREKDEGKKKRIEAEKKAAAQKKKADAEAKKKTEEVKKAGAEIKGSAKAGNIKHAPEKAVEAKKAEAAKAPGAKPPQKKVEAAAPAEKPKETAAKAEAKPVEKKEPPKPVAKPAEKKAEPKKAEPPKKEEKEDEVA